MGGSATTASPGRALGRKVFRRRPARRPSFGQLIESGGGMWYPNQGMSKSPGQLPRHVAIIMDGNGRWAQRRGQPRVDGHRRGARSVKEVVRAAREIGLR